MTLHDARKLIDVRVEELIRRPSWKRGWYIGKIRGGTICIIDHRCSNMEFAFRKADLKADDYEVLATA